MPRAIHHRHKIKPKRSIFKNPVFWWSILFLILAAAAIYFFFFWQYFQVKNIQVSGNKDVQTADLEKMASGEALRKILFFDSKSIFLFDPGKLAASILKDYPEINSALAQKKFPQTVTVLVSERQPFAIICGFKDDPTDLCFLMDEKGIIFKETSIEDPSLVLVQQHGDVQPKLGDEIIDSQVMAGISRIKQDMEKDFNPLDIVKADIVSAGRMDVTTNEGWLAYFDLSSDMNLQVTKLSLLLEKTFPKPEDRAKLHYIDLRFENKAYYK